MVWLESKILCPPIRLRAWLETKGLGEMEGKYSYFYFTHHLFIFLIFTGVAIKYQNCGVDWIGGGWVIPLAMG